ncbi:diaminopropionate ammonia-lyase [Blastococcus colisei]|uniref:Diaminopropionate ammonia-lyase n=1 Tax=Blastococcus colisei TaxID=1564162 RepID=A0A543PGB4_9ACTN|nr:pyridoxal-phosphate dependent enzyme [Blastococcus colisei]TQN43086.1 diaminopropionate ammonia-lyase [Blastococcus colisei]
MTTSEPMSASSDDPGDGTWFLNPGRYPAWTCPAPPPDVRDFHRTLPGYAPTGLADLPALARELGVAHVVAKDESNRLGLPAFKGLGASWAIHRALSGRTGSGAGEHVTIVTATDGNHGRAVARFARLFGHRADVFVPDGVHPAAVQAIHDEGAQVSQLAGTYDEAVHAAATHAAQHDDRLLVQDTAWDGYEDVPNWIVDGYSTLFAEIDDQLRARELTRPDLVVVPTGVGSLLQAALAHYRSNPDLLATSVVSAEPVHAACVLASVTAGRPVAVGTGPTAMAGLNCGTVSTLAWPYIAPGLDACVTVTDAQAARAARDLQALGVPTGPCGAAPLAAVRTLNAVAGQGRSSSPGRSLDLSPTATVVLLVTEGTAANPGLLPTGSAE